MYFVLAIVFTWLILSSGVAANLGLISSGLDGTVLTILGGLGSLSATIVMTHATAGTEGGRRIFERIFNWRINLKWWAASVVVIAVFFGISAFVGMSSRETVPDPKAGIYLNGGSTILVILLLLFGSFGEEPGWRGFALPKLQE